MPGRWDKWDAWVSRDWYAVIDVRDPATGKRKFHSLEATGKREAQIDARASFPASRPGRIWSQTRRRWPYLSSIGSMMLNRPCRLAHRLKRAQDLLRLGVRQTAETIICTREDGLPLQPDTLTIYWDRHIAKTALPASASTICATPVQRTCCRRASIPRSRANGSGIPRSA
jgi:hypothetical protein